MVHSMTAFARAERQFQRHTLWCEIRSVNQRFLDAGFRLPDAARACEGELREQLRKRLSRGKIEVTMKLVQDQQRDAGLALNQAMLSQVLQNLDALTRVSDRFAAPDPLEVLRWPGVLVEEELPPDLVAAEASALFADALTNLLESRAREGARLVEFIGDRLTEMERIVQGLRIAVPAILDANRNRLRERIAELRVEVDQARFEQELVYLAQRTDVDEELDRLATHIQEVRRVLASTEPAGRRLDFLMQELNREANTLSSKSMATETTLNAVDLKVLIEQMREQVQNIE